MIQKVSRRPRNLNFYRHPKLFCVKRSSDFTLGILCDCPHRTPIFIRDFQISAFTRIPWNFNIQIFGPNPWTVWLHGSGMRPDNFHSSQAPWIMLIWKFPHHCAFITSCFLHVPLFVTLWTIAHQAPLSMGILQARVLEWAAMPSTHYCIYTIKK